MTFGFTPIAYAGVVTLMNNIERVIINPFILFLFAAATAYFLYGVALYFIQSDNEEVHKKSKSHMLWGLFGMFIMVGVFGIMRLILNTVQEGKININNSGQIQINTTNNSANNPIRTQPDINKGPNNGEATTSYTQSPFTNKYISDSTCWRAAVYVRKGTEEEARAAGPDALQVKFRSEVSDPVARKDPNLPVLIDDTVLLDPFNTHYYYWMGAVAPINGGPCVPELDRGVPPIANQSDLRNADINDMLTNFDIQTSDAKSWHSVGSGKSLDKEEAYNIAVRNARSQIATKKGDKDLSKVSSNDILKEKVWQTTDKYYHYWIAISSTR